MMYLQFLSAGFFLLRPKDTYNKRVNAYVKAENPLLLVDCSSADAKWKVHNGQVVSERDLTRCLAHNLGSFSL